MKVNQGTEDLLISSPKPYFTAIAPQLIQLYLMQLKCINTQIGHNYKTPMYSLNTRQHRIIQHMLEKLGLEPK